MFEPNFFFYVMKSIKIQAWIQLITPLFSYYVAIVFDQEKVLFYGFHLPKKARSWLIINPVLRCLKEYSSSFMNEEEDAS